MSAFTAQTLRYVVFPAVSLTGRALDADRRKA